MRISIYYEHVWVSSDLNKMYSCSDVYIVLHYNTKWNSIAGVRGEVSSI